VRELELLLLREGFEFPNPQQLAWIVYNSSFGFRVHESSTAEEIQRSRDATAVVVVNRVRQRINPAPGWERHAPSEDHGPARGTEPSVPVNRPGRSLDLPGNRDSYASCLAAARTALDRRWMPLESPALLGGAQAYGHVWVCCWPPTVADSVNHCPVVLRFGPFWSPGGAGSVPERYFETRSGERRCTRCHRDLSGFRQYLLVGRGESFLRRARDWERAHAGEIRYPETIDAAGAR
jgi:hypothetical protein